MAEKGFKSKPTTIRSAEVVSYSRLMVSDDMATFRTLIEYRGMITTYLIGNIDNLVSSLRMVTSKMFGVPLRSVTIYMVCDHFFSYYTGRFGDTGGTPHYLKVLVDGKNITEQIIKEEFFSNVTTIAKRTPVIHGHPYVASSVFKIIKGILFDTKELGHAPEPNGLPSGYPVRLSSNGVEIFLPDELSLDDAIKINTESQIFEGVESIEDDGSVVLTDKSAGIFKELLDFDCKAYTIENVESKSNELAEKFDKWSKQLTN